MWKEYQSRLIAVVSRLSRKHLLVFLSIAVGFMSGLVAVILKNSVYGIQWLLTERLSVEGFNFSYIFYPTIGLFITTYIVLKVIKQHPGPGIPTTLHAISRRKSTLKRSQIYASLVTSIFTVGFGGSAGLEAPAVQTSAALGSNLGSILKQNYKTKTLLIACAAAGSMAAIFKAPVAAIIFAVEVIMIDLTTASLVPLLLASLSAFITSFLLLGDHQLLRFQSAEPFMLSHVHHYVLLGVICGLASVYFNKIYLFITSKFQKLVKPWTRVLIGGFMLGVIVLVFPPLYGEGYDVINSLLADDLESVTHDSIFHSHTSSIWWMFVFLIGLAVLKAIATGITLGSGGVGGIFAPTLFMGSTIGFLYTRVYKYFEFTTLPTSNFALVGMAGLMAGLLHAPLTAIFLIAEITGGYDLYVPLMLTAAIAFYISKLFSAHNIYTVELAQKGDLITHNKDKAVLTLMNLQQEIEKDFKSIHPEQTLRQLLKVLAQSKRNVFPVLDPTGNLMGVVTLDDFREIMFDESQYDEILVQTLMTSAPEVIDVSDRMDVVMKKFDESGAWNLPVVNRNEYVGFVSKSRLFSAYRKMLKEFS
jgi:chloride channel protein, CIC family